ncbi:MFS general substrate transporter [Amylostereum chailletii]|nr:MFS general substrate transporter [Amylostereum chailletii]
MTPKPIAAEYPEGGFQAWMTVFGALLLQFAAGYTNVFGVYQDFFVQNFLSDFTPSQISWIGSVATFITFSGGLISGRLFDRGYFYPLIIGGSVLVVFCLFMLSLAQPQHYYQVVFLTLGLGYGIGTGMIYVPTVAIVSHYFLRRRALAMGIVSSGTSLGALLHPIMLNNLFHGSTGFANGVRASAGLIGGTMLISVLIMRTRLPPSKTANSGLAKAAWKFAHDGVYLTAFFGMFLFVQGIFFPLVYIQLDSDEHGLSRTFGFYSLAMMNGAGFFGRLAGGATVNHLGVFNTLVFCGFACSALVFSMVAVHTIAGVTLFSLLYGFFSGAYVSLLSPMMASLASDVSEIGFALIAVFVPRSSNPVAWTPITGALLGRKFTWWRPAVYAGVMTFSGTVLFLVCRFVVARRKGTAYC